MKKYKILICIILFLLTSCAKPFEQGIYENHVYKNSTFGLSFTFPDEFKQESRESIQYIQGCKGSAQFSWQEMLENCKPDDQSNFIWEVVLSNQMGTKLTGIAVKELDSSTRTSTDLITGLKEDAEQWINPNDFITAPYTIKIGGLDFEAFSTIRSNENEPDVETFGMTAVHVSNQKAILITISIKTNDKQEFNQIMNIYTAKK